MINRIDKENKFWDSFAKRYDGFMSKRSSSSYKDILDRVILDTMTTENMLEIACGTGTLTIKLCPYISTITAIDLSPEMIEIAKKHKAENNTGNISFKLGDACNIPFPDNSFDTVLAVNVLHLLFEPDLAMKEIKRVLKDGGNIIVPTYCHGETVISHIVSWLMSLSGFKSRNAWSISSLQSYIKSHGFKIIETKTIPDTIPLVYLHAVRELSDSVPVLKEKKPNF